MSTLLLTSSGFAQPVICDQLTRILHSRNVLNIVYISTAAKAMRDDTYAKKELLIMRSLGFDVTEIDLAEIEQQKDLKDIFQGKQAVYIQGGNGFYLLKHVKKSGFDEIIKPLVQNGLIYIGKSAGSYIACPTIEMHTWASNKWDKFNLTDLTALGLVPFLVSVHFNETRRKNVLEGIKKTNYQVKILTDDQALVIEDGLMQFIGKGEEITGEDLLNEDE